MVLIVGCGQNVTKGNSLFCKCFNHRPWSCCFLWGFFLFFFFIYWSTVVDRILHYQTLPNTERFHCIPVALFNFATVHSLDYKEYLKVFFVAVSNALNFSLRKYERFLCKNKLLSTVWVCVYISILTYIHLYTYCTCLNLLTWLPHFIPVSPQLDHFEQHFAPRYWIYYSLQDRQFSSLLQQSV